MLEVHPYANLIPVSTDEEYANLVESIRMNGLREDIVLYEGKILDGRHRARACEETGVKPRTEIFEGDDPVAYVIDLNINRRHLDPSQLALVGAEAMEPLEEEAARRRAESWQHRGTSAPDGALVEKHRAADDAAKLTGASARNIQRAKRVVDAVKDTKRPASERKRAAELVDEIRAGRTSVTKADSLLAGKDKAHKQSRAKTKEAFEIVEEVQRKGTILKAQSIAKATAEGHFDHIKWDATPAGEAAKKAHKLFAKAISTDSEPEAEALALKALRLAREHGLLIGVVTL